MPVGVLNGLVLVSGGSGYTTPVVIFRGGGGSGAQGTARVSNGVVYSVDLINGGSGYTSAPTVTLNDPDPRASGAVVSAILNEPAPIGLNPILYVGIGAVAFLVLLALVKR